MNVDDPDDEAVAARWTGSLPPPDAALVRPRSAAEIAAAAREALADHRGYLRDAALAFRPWDVDVAGVRCPTTLWYGGADERALPGAAWFAARIPHARVVVRPGVTHWATLAAYWPEVLTHAGMRRRTAPDRWVRGRSQLGGVGSDHLVILVTRPAPTVRPPSRMANRRPSSMAIGWISSTAISVLSPGMTISVPSGRVTTPVTSVVRK